MGGEPLAKRKWVRRVVAAGIVLALVAVIIASRPSSSQLPPGPMYQGKSAAQWFALAEKTPRFNFPASESGQAFLALEGDVVPWLVLVIQENSISRFSVWREKLRGSLPAPLASLLPNFRLKEASQRQEMAFQLLGLIGEAQYNKVMDGAPCSSRVFITNAFPAFRQGLRSPVDSVVNTALGALTSLRFLAAPLAPEMVAIAANPKNPDRTVAAEALGSVGAAASNAVPALIKLAASADVIERDTAFRALGGMGPAARAAAPILAQALADPDHECRKTALRALCQTGLTPDAALATLNTLWQGTNVWYRTYAGLALWNHDRQNTELFQATARAMHGDGIALLSTLATMGPDAAPFIPELQAIAASPESNPGIRRVLRRLTNAAAPR